METNTMTLGQLLYKDIDSNEYLNEIYDAALFNYSAAALGLDVEKKEIVVPDALRFADILSKSVDPQNSDRHKIYILESLLYGSR